MAWVSVIVAGLLEVVWAVSLQRTEGVTTPDGRRPWAVVQLRQENLSRQGVRGSRADASLRDIL